MCRTFRTFCSSKYKKNQEESNKIHLVRSIVMNVKKKCFEPTSKVNKRKRNSCTQQLELLNNERNFIYGAEYTISILSDFKYFLF